MKKVRKDIICLGGGVESLPIIQRVHALGYHPIILDANAKCAAAEWHKSHESTSDLWLANVYSPISVRQCVQKKLAWQNKNYKTYNIAGVLCCATDAPDSQAALAEMLRTPTIGKRAAELGRNKWLQYERLFDNSSPVPETILLDVHSTDADEFDIIKPVAGRGARGVRRFTKDDFREALLDALGNSLPGYKKAVAQKWISGVQLSTESVIVDGELIFTAVAHRNYSLLGKYHPHIIEDGCEAPFYLSPDQSHSLNDILLRAALALGWETCTLKGDIVFDEDMFYILELAPRLSGGLLCSHIIPAVYGYPIVDAAISICTGARVPKYEKVKEKYACQRYIFPKDEWIGRNIASLPAPPEIGDTTLYRSISDFVRPVTCHADRLGQYIATAHTSELARRRCIETVDIMSSKITVK